MSKNLKVLLIAPHISREATGEGFVAYKWAEQLQLKVELTVLALQSKKHTDLALQLPQAKVITWAEPPIPKIAARFVAMFKPQWFYFQHQVVKYLAEKSEEFDIAHQIMPQGMRYASPLRKSSTPYVIGPLGGSLSTPTAFRSEMRNEKWYTRFRILDGIRLRMDPSLRASYAKAAMVLGVAPYVREKLQAHNVPFKLYRNLLELGVDAVEPQGTVRRSDDLVILHVGRGVRNKGLRDVVRAMALLSDKPALRLVSVGGGHEIEVCRQEAANLGISDRVSFVGHVPRKQVEEIYSKADIFAFPSFREPAGNVIYEAMRWGLPVIAANRGGPQWTVDHETGIHVAVESPTQLATDVAEAIRRLVDNPDLRMKLGEGGRRKLLTVGLWPKKADMLIELYHEALSGKSAAK